ncbi:hypothetical protein Poly30_17620 [Planctomycetes bacterium Poly30]|uniref:Uncharacterized protein n=1 Tax=Saltatorellus ferox TaxID=2528018 RepID=A0A518EQ85_9BACT|nr:hypothetical protein Poly30_17620 [Planctomycetes bacterium Poly30]
MPSETTEAVRQSSSHLWLVAGIPTLLILAFLLYTAVSQSKKSGETGDVPSEDSSQATSPDDE